MHQGRRFFSTFLRSLKSFLPIRIRRVSSVPSIPFPFILGKQKRRRVSCKICQFPNTNYDCVAREYDARKCVPRQGRNYEGGRRVLRTTFFYSLNGFTTLSVSFKVHYTQVFDFYRQRITDITIRVQNMQETLHLLNTASSEHPSFTVVNAVAKSLYNLQNFVIPPLLNEFL